MDLPKPPEDVELKNIIDKLAQFVARNGPEFEQMTKNKQKDNPKFSFLFGGQHFNYYQYRVTTEQAILRQKQKNDQQMGGNMNAGYQPPPPPGHQYAMGPSLMGQVPMSQAPLGAGNTVNQLAGGNIHYGGPVNVSQLPPPPHPGQGPPQPPPPSQNIFNQQLHELQEQIRESEKNLIARHQVLLKQQQILIDDTILKAQDDKLRQMAQDFNLNLHEFDSVLQPIANTCTKDSISMGKSWIFSRCQTPMHYDIVARFLHKKITSPGQAFESKLHLLYLINDLLNHCYRKGTEHLRRSLESVIIPIYCTTFMESNDEKQQRLIKLLKLWESNQYLDPAVIEQLHKPQIALVNYQTALCNEYASLITPITTGTINNYNQLQKQHSEFVAHQTTKIQQLQQQQQIVTSITMTAPVQSIPLSSNSMMAQPQQPPPYGHPPPPTHQPPHPPSNVPMYPPPPIVNQAQIPPPTLGGPQLPLHLQQNQHHQMMAQLPPTTSQPPPFGPPSQPLPGGPPLPSSAIQPTSVPNPQFFSTVVPPTGPPPGVGPAPPQITQGPPMLPKEPTQPDVPYYELPAGLMVPLVKLEDFEYRPLDPKKIRLPPPAPPSERLLKAVEAFYAPPSHDHPRIGEGWEPLSLYEFFRAKSQAKNADKKDEPGSNSSDNDDDDYNDHHRRRRSSNSYSEKSSSRSPKRKYREERSPRRGRHRSSSRSSDSRSPSPRHRRRSRSKSRSRSRSRGRYRSRSRSFTPPSSSSNYSSYNKNDTNRKLDESNKGHQMLKRMGWSERAGLGANNQGIQEPVSAGDTRIKEDYKGIGVNNMGDPNDPYEAFRKNKGQAFLHRVMKSRADR